MAVLLRAGQRESYAEAEAAPRTGDGPLGNLKPIGRHTAGMIGEWVDLLARISHDLRTPLNAVIGFSDAMQHELFGPLGHARYQEYARHIRTSSDQLLRAAEDTLTMTALLASQRPSGGDDLRLASLVSAAVAEIDGSAGIHGISITHSLDADIEIKSDGRTLPRAMRYLVAAAVAKAARGADIKVHASCRHGHVALGITVSDVNDAAIEARPDPSRDELGLGREELSIWLARMMLDLLGSPLELISNGRQLTLQTTFELSSQRDFFPSQPPQTA